MKTINYKALFSDGYVSISDFLSDQRNIDIAFDKLKRKNDNIRDIVGMCCTKQEDNKFTVTVYQSEGFYQFSYSLSDKDILDNELNKKHRLNKYPFDGMVNCAVDFYGKMLLTLATDDSHFSSSKYILLDNGKHISKDDSIKASAIGFYNEILISVGLRNITDITCIGKFYLNAAEEKCPFTKKLMEYMKKNGSYDDLTRFSGGPLYLVYQGQVSWLILLENIVSGKTPKYIFLWSALPDSLLYNENVHISLLIQPSIPPLALFDKPSLAIAYPYEGGISSNAKNHLVPQICIEILNDRYIISNLYDINKRKVYAQYGAKTFNPSDLLRQVKAAKQNREVLPEDLRDFVDTPDAFDIVAIGYDEHLYHNLHQWHVTETVMQNNLRFGEEELYPAVIWHKRAVSIGFYSPKSKIPMLDQIINQYEVFSGPYHHYAQDEITHPFSRLIVNATDALLISSDIWGCNVYKQQNGALILDHAFDMINDRVNDINQDTIYLPKTSDTPILSLDNGIPIEWIGDYQTSNFVTISLDENWKNGVPLKKMLAKLDMQEPDFWINIRGTITPSATGNTFEKLCFQHFKSTGDVKARNTEFPLIRCSVIGKGRRMLFVATYFEEFVPEIKNDFTLSSKSFGYFILEETNLEDLIFSLNIKQQDDKNNIPDTSNRGKKNRVNTDWKNWLSVSTAIIFPDDMGNAADIMLDNGTEYIEFPSFLHSYPAAINAGARNTIAQHFSTAFNGFDNKQDLKFIIWKTNQKAIICCGNQIGDASFQQKQFSSVENIRPVIDPDISAAVVFYGNILTWNGSSYALYNNQFNICKKKNIITCVNILQARLSEVGVNQPDGMIFLGTYLHGKVPELDKEINNLTFGEASKYNNQLFYGFFQHGKLTVISIPNQPNPADYKVTVLWINERLNKFIS